MSRTIVITGGGTGGHVFPALAVAEELKNNFAYDLHWIGARGGIEESLVSRWGLPFHGIPAGKLRRYFSWRNFVDAFKILAGIVGAFFILKKLKPLLLFSKGGFVSVPPVLAARFLGVPVISHESDFDPGLATKINSRFSRFVCVPYEASAKFFPPGKAVVTGNPIRREIFEGRAELGRKLLGGGEGNSDLQKRPLLFVQGGSLGARQINRLLALALPELVATFAIVHQRGEGDWDLPDLPGRYVSRPFFKEEYPHLLAAADVVLSRAGAGSLWELGATRKPSVLVPLVEGSRGDQARNAELCEKSGCALVFYPDPTSPENSAKKLGEILQGLAGDPETLKSMAKAWDGLIISDAAKTISALVHDTITNEGETGGRG